jgi:hypothetical protein
MALAVTGCRHVVRAAASLRDLPVLGRRRQAYETCRCSAGGAKGQGEVHVGLT